MPRGREVVGHGRCRSVPGEGRPRYDHSTGTYGVMVYLPDGSEALVTSRTTLGPWRVTAPWRIVPQSIGRGQ
jgi:hypothetical protein